MALTSLPSQQMGVPRREFETHQTVSGPDAGFQALEISRKNLVEKLIDKTRSASRSWREALAQEIFQAFYIYYKVSQTLEAGVAAPNLSFRKKLREFESQFQDLESFCKKELQENFSSYPFKDCLQRLEEDSLSSSNTDPAKVINQLKHQQQSIYKRLGNVKTFQLWLKENRTRDKKYIEAHKAVKDKYKKTEKSLIEILEYCSDPKTYAHYVKKFDNAISNAPPLGCSSATLYAKACDISLYIWEPHVDDPEKLVLVDGSEGTTGFRKDILKISGIFHKLIPIGAVARTPPTLPKERPLIGRVRAFPFKEAHKTLITPSLPPPSDLIVPPPISRNKENSNEDLSSITFYTSTEFSGESQDPSTYERVKSNNPVVTEMQKRVDELLSNKSVGTALFHEYIYLSSLLDRYLSLPPSEESLDELSEKVEQLSLVELEQTFHGLLRERATVDQTCSFLEQDFLGFQSRHGISGVQLNRVKEELKSASKKIIQSNTASDIIVRFLRIWIDYFKLVDAEFIESSADEISKQLYSLYSEDRNRASLLSAFFDYLIRASDSKKAVLSALNKLTQPEKEGILFFRENEEQDDLLIAALNREEFREQDSYDRYLLFARVFLLIAGKDEARLTNLFLKIRFSSSGEFPRALYKVYVEEQEEIEISMHFLNAITKSMKVSRFNDKETVLQSSDKTVKLFDQLLANESPLVGLATRLREEERPYCIEGKFFPHTLLTPLFLYCTLNKRGVDDPLTLYRVLYHLGNNISASEQDRFCEKIAQAGRRSAADVNDSSSQVMTRLVDCLRKAYQYFNDNKSTRTDHFRKLWKGFREKLVGAVRETKDKSIEEVVALLENIFHHTCSTKGTGYLLAIFNYRSQIGAYQTGYDAVEGVIEDVMGKGLPINWKVDTILERLFLLKCYVVCPIDLYHKRFQNANTVGFNGEDIKEYIETQLPATASNLEQMKAGLLGHDHLPKIGFKVLQYSQLFAVKCAIDPPDDAQAIFLKVGTGQGKSLIIALAALHYAKTTKQKVTVVTVYPNLAKRDYTNFKMLFEQYGIQSGLIDNATSQTQIVYSDLHTYFSKMHDQGLRRVAGNDREDEFDFFEPGTVILDEFDSILLDTRDFEIIVRDMKGKLEIPDLDQADFSDRQTLANKLDSTLEGFFPKLKEHKLDEGFANWFSESEKRKFEAGGETSPDALGYVFHTVDAPFYQLMRQKLSGRVPFFKLFAFLKSAHKVIGVSGSTSRQATEPFKELFSKGCAFFDVPPFFDNSKPKLKRMNAERLPCSDDHEWMKSIFEAIEFPRGQNRPVLIFTTLDKWKDLENNLKQKFSASQLVFMKEPGQVTDETLKHAVQPKAVTLATIAAGRGADFKIPDDILPHICNENLDEGGLHVIISYIPKKNGKKDTRQIIQMAGRSGRWDQPGTWEIIATESEKNLSEVENKVDIDDYEDELHQLSREIYTLLQQTPRSHQVWQRFIWFNHFLENFTSYPESLRRKPDQTDAQGRPIRGEKRSLKEQAQLVVENVLGAGARARIEIAPRGTRQKKGWNCLIQ